MKTVKQLLAHPLVILLYVGLLAHGQMFLNNGIFWDSYLTYHYYLAGDAALLHKIMFSLGQYYAYPIMRVYWFLGYHGAVNIGSWCFIMMSGLFTYGCLRFFDKIPQSIALLVGAIVIAFPGSLLTVFRCVCQYYVAYGSFFMAAYFGFYSEMIKTKMKIIFRLLSLIIFFFVSFNLQSILMFYGIFVIGLYLLYVQNKGANIWSIKHVLYFVITHLDFFMLPFLYRWLIVMWFSPSGQMLSYNKMHMIPLPRLYDQLWKSCFYSIWRRMPIAVGVITVIVLFLEVFKKRFKNVFSLPVFMFGLGVVAIFLGLVPYILVGKAPSVSFIYLARSAILLPLGVALFSAGIFMRYFINSDATFTRLGKVMMVILFLNCIIFWNIWYLRLQSQSALQKALIVHLKAHPKWAEKYSVFWIRAKFPKHNKPLYADYAWSGLLNLAYGADSHYGNSDESGSPANFKNIIRPRFTKSYREYLFLNNVNFKGCQALMLIFPNKYGSNYINIGLHHLFYRFLNPQALPQFFENLIKVKVYFYNSWAATDCDIKSSMEQK